MAVRLLLVFILSTVSTQIFCQLKAVLSISPNISDQQNWESYNSTRTVDLYEPIATFDISITVEKMLGKHFYFKSGIGYSQKGYELDKGQYRTIANPDPVIVSSPDFDRTYKVGMLEIPIALGFAVVDNDKLNLTCYLGYVNNFAIHEKETIFPDRELLKYVPGMSFDISFDYSISEKIGLRCAPTFKNLLRSIYKEDDKHTYYSYGLAIGVIYKFH